MSRIIRFLVAFTACLSFCAHAAVDDHHHATSFDSAFQRSTTAMHLAGFLERSLSHHVILLLTHTTPRFAYLHPTREQDDDEFQVQEHGVLEPGITALWQGLIRDACQSDLPALIVDVGVNFGFCTTLTSALGCRVIGFEPVHLFREIAILNVASFNPVRNHVRISSQVVSNSNENVTICYPDGSASSIMGTAGVRGANGANGFSNDWVQTAICENHTATPLSRIINEPVCLLKIDVEGMEPYVMEGARGLLDTHVVQNVILEFSPALTHRPGLPSRADQVAMLKEMAGRG